MPQTNVVYSCTSFQVSKDLEEVAAASSFIASPPVGYWRADGTFSQENSEVPTNFFCEFHIFPAYDATALCRACTNYGGPVTLTWNPDHTITGTQVDFGGNTHTATERSTADVYGLLFIQDVKALDSTD